VELTKMDIVLAQADTKDNVVKMVRVIVLIKF
jgi:hypothetical protein